jgi:hypothetical protein
MKRLLLAIAVSLFAHGAGAANDPAKPACKVSGKKSMSIFIHSAPEKGEDLAQLQYGEWWIDIVDFPADSQHGRLRMRARRDHPSIRVDAWVSGAEIDFYAQRDLPIIVDHVSISVNARLRLYHPEAAVFDGEPWSPTFEKTRTPIACDDIGFSQVKVPIKPAGKGRDVLLKAASAPLFDSPTGKIVFTLVHVEPYPTPLEAFEKANGMEHVRYDGDVHVDGWVRSSDLRDPKPEDNYGLGGLGLTGTGGGYGSSAKAWTARVDTEIHLGKDAKAPLVGILEKGARVWITKGSDWSEIRMVDSAALPPKGKSFYVRTADLDP